MMIIKLTDNVNIVSEKKEEGSTELKVAFRISINDNFSALSTEMDAIKYMRMLHSSFDGFYTPLIQSRLQNAFENEHVKKHQSAIEEYLQKIPAVFNETSPFSYKKAFEITENSFRVLVFSLIRIDDMLKELGHTRYKTDGITLTQKKYDKNGEFLSETEQSNVYEVHKVNGEGLGVTDELYAVKCWCTTTNKEHWLWIEKEYKDDPLEAIASTFRIHKSIMPHIKCLKRQGDVLLVELLKDVTPDENDEIVPLTKEQYFRLLEAQS